MRPCRVLFVCIGNACRSQMAEAFARHLGAGVLEPASAGLAPAGFVAPDTLQVMAEKNIDLQDCQPKGLDHAGEDFDLIVNLSGYRLPPGYRAPVREWDVPDPVALSLDRHREVRDQIEALVNSLILEFRAGPPRI
jgi:protein-tyrosine-phosphatase